MTPSSNLPSARKLACEGLYDIFYKESYANLTIQNLLRRYPLRDEERRFMTELIYGVLRRWNVLLWIMGQLSSRPVRKMHPVVQILLALGLYQLRFLDHVPPSAAVNETVKLARKMTHQGNAGFVNAILRNYLRKADSFVLPEEARTPEETALLYNEPAWLVKKWTKDWGRARTEAVCRALNEIQPMQVRANTLKMSVSDVESMLEKEGLSPAAVPFATGGFFLGKTPSLFQASWLSEGLAYVQNASSMVPALMAAPKAGDRVLDMCAAPGSKTTQMAAMMGNEGTIDAWDLYPHKIKLIEDNCRRLGITCVRGEVRDASIPDQSRFAAYDTVLLDAPCSGLGVLGRKLELRWRRKEEDLAAFPPLQKQLLDAAASYVRPGGILVYSTCTLNKAENEEMAADFLQRHDEFEAVPYALEEGASAETMTTLWPDETKSDGFFAVKLRRRES